MAAEKKGPSSQPDLVPSGKDVPVRDCEAMSDEELTAAVLQAGADTVGGCAVGGTK